MREIPERYDSAAAETDWRERWEGWGIHRWDPGRSRQETFVVDTPPPTVSGSLHVGHVFSYTHQDLIVRFQRMNGKNIHYGMGWDDNGLPTERRVQNVFGIRCDPKLPYDAKWTPRRDKGKGDEIEEVSRRNFIEACAQVTLEDEQVYEHLWRRLGLSIDWKETYATIDDRCRRISQISFLDLVAKGQVYQTEAPTMWDVDFKTAVAQAEVEDREQVGSMYDIRFGIEGGGEFVIATTRPELLAACIAVVAHPDDARYQPLFGKNAITPVYGMRVPILPAAHADPEKGTGILMVCTFGDIMDVEFWKGSGLPLRQIIGRDGKIRGIEWNEPPFQLGDPERARRAHEQIAGLNVKRAKAKMVEILAAYGSAPNGNGAALAGDPRPVQQSVKFYEKGDRPLEFVTTRQWFVRILAHKEDLLAQGRRINWHPSFMQTRFEHWVEGLGHDWCISRQRYFGVPFPVWYPLQADGSPAYDRPIFADRASLPIDPMSSAPPGYTEDQRDRPGGFTGDPDVMDTWATSSLTPQIQSCWEIEPERHRKLFPMDIRPQSHEIIRTWAFYTIVKAWMHENEIPWKNVVISGWILDPDRKKMSKSKGNALTPEGLLDEHSVDAVRYWAGRARLGTDTAFDDSVFKIGKKLVTKVFNASRFVFMQIDRVVGDGAVPGVEHVQEALDLALLARLEAVTVQATEAFARFDYATALQASEDAFWDFCDNYLELVKTRSYAEDDTPGRRSAIATLHLAISVFLRLLAPFLPYVTEEVWSWRLSADARRRSVHTAPWPGADEFPKRGATGPEIFTAASDVLGKIRGAKSDARRSLKWPVTALEVSASRDDLAALEVVLADVLRAGAAEGAAVRCNEGAVEGERFAVKVELGEATEG